MPLILNSSLPEQFTAHSSGGEHSMKHASDPDDVNAHRVRCGLDPFGVELDGYMSNCGLVVVRHAPASGGWGEIAGYAITDNTSSCSNQDIIEVFVEPEEQGRGIGGFLLGKLIEPGIWEFPQRGMAVYKGPTTASYRSKTYFLPGDYVKIDPPNNQTNDFYRGIDEFKGTIESIGASLVLDIGGGINECVLFRDGEEIFNLGELQPSPSGSVFFDATHYLNRQHAQG